MTDYSLPSKSTQHPLDQPYVGVGPITAVKRFYQNYARFSGRASRSEYWWFTLVYLLVLGVLGVLAGVLGAATGTTDYTGAVQPGPAFAPFAILLLLITLANIVPSIALTVRRLHDANFSGLLYLVNFVPYLGSLVLVVLNILPSNPLGARFDAPGSGGPAQPYQNQTSATPYTQQGPPAPPTPPVA
jgi:uncharacterized membrane protein YhaH (DUF805 family)